jgi:hypothetical protein
MVLASAAGVFVPGTYGKETTNWATQATSQDVANLLLAGPTLFVSAYLVHKKSLRAFLVWLGALLYVIYSYVIYAFFIHFGPWFLVYAAILGLSFYCFLGGLMALEWNTLLPRFAEVRVRPASVFLMIVALMFYFLAASETVKALLSHTIPQGLKDVGLVVNPIHVLDMALFLPAMAIVSVKLWKRKTLGLILAGPFLTLTGLMGSAIFSIMLFLSVRGFPAPSVLKAAIAVLVLIAFSLTVTFLKEVKQAERIAP